SLRSTDTRDALMPQDGLYTLAIRSSGEEKLRVIGSIGAMLVAPEDPGAVLAALTDPRTRIVTLTITEKAYLRAAGGGLDAAHPDIVHDLENREMPKPAHGFLTEALARRHTAGTPPFTVLCCDNLPANGATLHRLLIEFAMLRDARPAQSGDAKLTLSGEALLAQSGAGVLAKHIADQVAFPSSMVDRIVP